MKKLFSLLTVIMAFLLAFTGCSSDEEEAPYTGDPYIYPEYELNGTDEDIIGETFEENVVTSVTDLANFFKIEDPQGLDEKFGYLFYMARNDNYVVRPLVNGIDVSTIADWARIEIVPPAKDGDYSHIAYYYTNTVYNYAIKVYYLYDTEFNVAKIGGYQALIDGDESVVTRENYNGFTIVNYLPEETSYAEYFLNDRYFITITGANIKNDKFPNVIEKEALDILTFDEIQIADTL